MNAVAIDLDNLTLDGNGDPAQPSAPSQNGTRLSLRTQIAAARASQYVAMLKPAFAPGMLRDHDRLPRSAAPNPSADVTAASEQPSNSPADTIADNFSATAEWEGTVTAVGREVFTATIVQLPRGTSQLNSSPRLYTIGPAERTELPIEDIPPSDRDLLVPGSLFRMVIGYQIAPSGQRRRSLSVVFRRLPKWRRSDLLKAAREAQDEQSIFDSLPMPNQDHM